MSREEDGDDGGSLEEKEKNEDKGEKVMVVVIGRRGREGATREVEADEVEERRGSGGGN